MPSRALQVTLRGMDRISLPNGGAWPVCKEYEVKIKNCTGAMTTPKNEVLIGLLLKNFYSVGAKNLWWKESTGVNFG